MKRAALIAVAVLLPLTPLVLHARTTTTFGQNAVGAVCNNVEKGVDFDAIAQCNAGTGAGTMQTAPIILGTLTAPPYANTTCDSGKAGMLQWTGTSFQACGGTSWGSLAAGGALDDLTDAKTDYASLYNVFLGSGAGDAITGGSNNTALGYFALYSNTTGSDNTALGSTALYSNTTGSWNTAVGREALYSNSTGASNTALGMRALRTNSTGNYNTAVGRDSLYSNTSGHANTALGYFALYSNTTGSDNTALGSTALYSNTTGSWNTAVGREALYSNSTGASNTALGMRALRTNSTGNYNTAVGRDALYSNTSGHANTALGYYALPSTTTGFGNTAIGYNALYSNTSGVQNVALGAGAQYANSTGNYNTALGVGALQVKTTGSNNTALGYGVGQTTLTTGSNNILIGTSSAVTTPASDTSNFLNIGNTIYGDLATGYVGIGTTTPRGTLDVARNLYVGTSHQDTTVNISSFQDDYPNSCSGNTTVEIGNSMCGEFTTVSMGYGNLNDVLFSVGDNAFGQTRVNIGNTNIYEPPIVHIGAYSTYANLHVGYMAESSTTSTIQLGQYSAGAGNLGIGAYSSGGISYLTLGYGASGGATAHIGYNSGGASTLNVGYGTGSNNSVVYIGSGASTGGTILELGAGSTGNHSSFIDITGDATYTDYGLRIARGSGPNGGSYIISRGTGALFFQTNEAGEIGFNTAGVRRMTISAAGNVTTTKNLVVNGSTIVEALTVTGGTASTGYRTRNGVSGAYEASKFNISWATSNARLYINDSNLGVFTFQSDYRLKKDVKTVESGLDRVMKLRPVSFRWKDIDVFKDDGKRHESFIAHELQEIIPSGVDGEKDAVDEKGKPQFQSLNMAGIVSVLTKGVQELANKVTTIEGQISSLLSFESRIAKLEAENKELKARLKATIAEQALKIEKLEKLNGELKKENQGFSERLKAIEDSLSQKP